MRSILAPLAAALFVAASPAVVCATAGPDAAAPLRLLKSLDLPGIDGDFDHFAADLKGNRLFLAAEEHHTVEVFDLQTGKSIHSITGLDTPHSIVYVPDVNRIFIVDGGKGGSCEVLDGTTYKPIKSIKLTEDADALVYDSGAHLLYVGNGGKEAGNEYSLITLIDTSKSEKVADVKLPSNNLEAMALQHGDDTLYVNMRDKNQVGLVNRKTHALKTTWQLTKVTHNTPMALDEPNHRLFVAGRKPGIFAVLDTTSGQEIATLPGADGVDDMAFDPTTRRIYIACAEGFVNVYHQIDANHYEVAGKVPTGNRGKIGLLVPELHRYFVSTSRKGDTPAKLLIFETAQ
jgi:DNA-binding beta-propeller fold protein YncE